MNYKATRKEIKERYDVYKVGYCNLQHLFWNESPFAYSTRAEGWACDYYDIGDGVVISTGYAPIGKDVPYALTEYFDNAAREIILHDDDPSEKLDTLIMDFRNELRWNKIKAEIEEILSDADWCFCLPEYREYQDFLADCIETTRNTDLLIECGYDTETRNARIAQYTVRVLESHDARNIYEKALTDER